MAGKRREDILGSGQSMCGGQRLGLCAFRKWREVGGQSMAVGGGIQVIRQVEEGLVCGNYLVWISPANQGGGEE